MKEKIDRQWEQEPHVWFPAGMKQGSLGRSRDCTEAITEHAQGNGSTSSICYNCCIHFVPPRVIFVLFGEPSQQTSGNWPHRSSADPQNSFE